MKGHEAALAALYDGKLKPVALMRDDAWAHGREGAAALAEERRNGHEER